VTQYEDVLGSEGIELHILHLGIRWRWFVSFMPQQVVHII